MGRRGLNLFGAGVPPGPPHIHKDEMKRTDIEPVPKFEFPFQGVNLLGRGAAHAPRYPRYLYKEGADPLRVESEKEEERARAQGYDNMTAAAMANKQLINWFWDLEDMSPKQLAVFAREEYGVDLPIDAGQDRLFKAVVELTRSAPQNRNRMVLMAHEVIMEYDATIEEIRRLASGPSSGCETETIEFEVYA